MTKTQTKPKQKKIAVVTGCILIAIISILGIINTICFRKNNITDEYQLFCDMEKIASEGDLKVLRATLAERKLDFKIADNRIVISEHPYIQFDVLDDGNLLIATNAAMSACKILDSEDLTKVIISGKAEKGEFHETVAFTQNKISYQKNVSQGTYIVIDQLDYIALSIFVVAIIASIIVCIIGIKKVK